MDFPIYHPSLAYLDPPLIKFSRFFPPPTIWTPRLLGTVEYYHLYNLTPQVSGKLIRYNFDTNVQAWLGNQS